MFFCFLGLLAWIVGYSIKNNQYKKFLSPTDADGRFCGYDDVVKDYPFIYYAAQIGYVPGEGIVITLTPVCA